MQKTRSDVQTAEHAIVTAQTDRKEARLASRKIASDLDVARPRRDVALLMRLQNDLGIATIAESAAAARIRWCKQQREVSKAQLAAATTHTYLAEARLEQARAHLAARHGRLPSGDYQLATFDEQAAQAVRKNDKQ